MLEPCEGKLSCTVLRGEGGSNTADLLDQILKKDIADTGCISYGRTGQDCRNDVLLDGLNTGISPNHLTYAELTCIAHGDGRIIVGISHPDMAAGKFVIINTADNTAELKEINIREE